MSDDNAAFAFVLFISIVFVVSCLFEVGLLLYAYSNADRVSCNFLWCEFTSERSSAQQYVSREVVSSRSCYENDVLVNCSSLGS
jgi:hypothetical protein